MVLVVEQEAVAVKEVEVGLGKGYQYKDYL